MLIGWSLVAGVAALYLGERIPQIREDLFSRIPFLGNYLVYFIINLGERYKIPCSASNGGGKSQPVVKEEESTEANE